LFSSQQPLLDAYAEIVRTWALRLNLVSLDDLDRIESRHVQDSLRLAPLLAEAPEGPCIDVGSGAGFPGIPLAITHPGRHWRLLEPRSRRAGFLEEAIRQLDLPNCEVIAQTAEQAAADPGLAGGHAFAAARALASPPEALELLKPLVAGQGIVALFIGSEAPVPSGAEEWENGIAFWRR
jgi:16S rRNA (guanine527-N7)-methyltransferase